MCARRAAVRAVADRRWEAGAVVPGEAVRGVERTAVEWWLAGCAGSLVDFSAVTAVFYSTSAVE